MNKKRKQNYRREKNGIENEIKKGTKQSKREHNRRVQNRTEEIRKGGNKTEENSTVPYF